MTNLENKLIELLEPIAVHMGFEFVGLRYLSQGKYSMLRIYIDKENGIDHNDCTAFSHQVSGFLDVEDLVRGEYTLEVSSPGIDRPLFNISQYAQFIGKTVKVRLTGMVDGKRKLIGTIQSVSNDAVSILADDKTWNLGIKQIEHSHLVAKIDWK